MSLEQTHTSSEGRATPVTNFTSKIAVEDECCDEHPHGSPPLVQGFVTVEAAKVARAMGNSRTSGFVFTFNLIAI
jgi:hypothetical protein